MMLVAWAVVKFERLEPAALMLLSIDPGEKGTGDMILLCWS